MATTPKRRRSIKSTAVFPLLSEREAAFGQSAVGQQRQQGHPRDGLPEDPREGEEDSQRRLSAGGPMGTRNAAAVEPRTYSTSFHPNLPTHHRL